MKIVGVSNAIAKEKSTLENDGKSCKNIRNEIHATDVNAVSEQGKEILLKTSVPQTGEI